MIVARICDKSGKPIAGSGSCKTANYEGKVDGWFPVDSFQFGFQKKPDATDAGAPGAAHAAPAKPSGGHSPAPAPDRGGGQNKPDLSLNKQIDTATCSLMMLFMSNKSSKKGPKESPLTVDIHLISTVAVDKEAERCTYTSLMIHLEEVNVEHWALNGSGDTRPTETVSLKFDKAAMIYMATADGKTFLPPVGPNGWDQTANDVFKWEDKGGRMKKYLPPGMSIPGF